MKELFAIAFAVAGCTAPFCSLVALCIYYEIRRARRITLGLPLEETKTEPSGFEVLHELPPHP